jgi:pyrimidine-nucleoside phosphorylase
MLPQWIIEKKRNGEELTDNEISGFINGYGNEEIPDYQMAALAMAIFFQGMTGREVTTLTDCMMRSGDMLDTARISLPKADKHSTGGVGDKVSLILAPLVACCGVAVPMISGRGLGITGGTLDKLESIPGYRTDLSTNEFLSTVDECGCSIIGQTARLAPVDRRLYALRDVTGTVPSIPLISASILSKKMAEGIDALVLDVKWGSGAFMKTLDQARELAGTMTTIVSGMGKRVAAILTSMNQPLGHTVGNAVEVIETVEALQGHGADDLMEVTMALSAHMLWLCDKASSPAEAEAQLKDKIRSGAAFEKFLEMVRKQGGDASVLENTGQFAAAAICHELLSPRDGYVRAVEAEGVGRACVVLGAGRKRVEDTVDHAVGVTNLCKIGQAVTKGEPLATVLANDKARLQDALALLEPAFDIGPEPPDITPLIREVIVGNKV